mgnify:CR=1 FL=1
MDITELTVHELQEKIKNKELTITEITKAYVDRMNEKEKDVQAFITELKDEALKQSEEIQNKIDNGEKLGDLAGIPIGIKDNIFYIYTLDLKVKNESKILKTNKNPDVTMAEYIKYEYPKADIKPNTRPIVVGFGPAGMFAALVLAQTGFKPMVFERGRDADNRLKDIEKLRTEGILNPNSNVQFGEGGAGTFSDGKLNTRIKNPRSRKVMEEFVLNGAPEEILYAHNPHIGTDRLVGVVKNIRERIISLGGEIHFESCITDIKTENGKIKSVVVNNDKEIPCDDVILSVGHSARDTFEMLYKKDIKMIQKPFAMGARIEHKQSMINKSQYGDEKKAEYFGPAEYKLTYTASNKRCLYILYVSRRICCSGSKRRKYVCRKRNELL